MSAPKPLSKSSRRWDDAIFELNEALRFRRSADYYAELGEINQAAGYWENAVAAYRNAAELDPSEPRHDLSAAQVWMSQYRVDLAVPILESLHTAHPDREDINRSLAYALSASVASCLTVLHDNSVLFTSAQQITRARLDIARALSLRFQDDGLRSQLDVQLREANQAAQSVWSFPPKATDGARWARRIGWLVAAWFAFVIPSSAVQPQGFGVILGLIALAAVWWGFFKLYRKPAWQRNAQRFRHRVRRWGI